MPTFVIPNVLTRLAPRCSPIGFRHERKSTLAGLTQGHSTDTHAIHHDDVAHRLDAKQSLPLNQQSNRETKLSENVVVCRRQCVDRPGYN